MRHDYALLLLLLSYTGVSLLTCLPNYLGGICLSLGVLFLSLWSWTTVVQVAVGTVFRYSVAWGNTNFDPSPNPLKYIIVLLLKIKFRDMYLIDIII